MTIGTITGLLNNTAFLLALGLLYDTLIGDRYNEKLYQVFAGTVIGFLGIALMMTPWEFMPGVSFDTRSVLLSVTGYFFGLVPTLLAVGLTGAFRLYSGGVGAWTGVAVIVTSGVIGLAWRFFHRKDLGNVTTKELYIMGIVVHVAMLLWMFSLPWQTALSVLSKISIPVILIFPVGNVLLGRLMSSRSKRKNIEKVLQKNQQELSDIFAMSPDMICTADINTSHFLKVNPSFTRILGYSEKELLNCSFLDFVHPEDINSTRALTRERLQKGEAIVDFKNRFRCKNGTYLWLEWASHTLSEPGIIFAVAHDITHRMKAEEERKKNEIQLQQSQKMEAIGTLAGGVAHEINNPINGIMNYAQMILDRLPVESQLKPYAQEIIHETERTAQIVRDLLTFSRDEKTSQSPARLVDIVDSTLSLIKTLIKKDQILIEVSISEDLPKIKCHSQQVQQVMMNLLINARDALNEKYSGYDGNKKISITSRLFQKEGKKWISTIVKDNGTGISPEIRDRIFDPFFTSKPKNVGTGLGLSISYGIIKAHHGNLTVESEMGKYTRFKLDLPVA